MLLPLPPRYGYSALPERPVYDWPNGGRLAFYLALNVEQFAFGKPGHAPHNWNQGTDTRIYAWRDYGLRVGIWHIFDLLDELQLPCCFLLNSAAASRYPQIMERIARRGDEVVAHGRTNSERPGDYFEEDERRVIREVTEVLATHHGKRPYGWMGPWISESPVTPDLLKEEGYKYIMHWPCDDQPIYLKTRSGPLLNVPYPIEINDAPAVLQRGHTGAEFGEFMTDQFDMMLRLSAKYPMVCTASLHTFVFGTPFRLVHLERALKHIARLRDDGRVWFASPGEIADHVLALPADRQPPG